MINISDLIHVGMLRHISFFFPKIFLLAHNNTMARIWKKRKTLLETTRPNTRSNQSDTNRTTRTMRQSQYNEKKAASEIEENHKGLFIKRELIITDNFNIKQKKIPIQ